MAAPTQPTTTLIVTEALTRFYNGTAPIAAEITRATDYGMEKVKRDIMLIGKTWKPLIRTAYDISISGVSHYPCPVDFEKMLSLGWMTGDHTGVLGTVTSTTVMALAAAEDITKVQADGKWLLITSGTGVDQARQIRDYTVSTKACIVDTAFDTLCVVGDGYYVINSIDTSLREIPMVLYDKYQHPVVAGTPKRFAIVPNTGKGSIALIPVPNVIAGLQIRYYADLMMLDLAGALYSTILRRWASIFEQGVYCWKLGEDDDRYQGETQLYQAMLLGLMTSDLDGYDSAAAQQAISGVK